MFRLVVPALLFPFLLACGGGGGGTEGAGLPAVPPSGVDVRVALIAGDSVNHIGMIAEADNGEVLSAFGPQDAGGNMVAIDGVTSIAPDGSALTVWLNDDGHPSAAEQNGYVFLFTKYVGSRVDIVIRAPNGDEHFADGVNISASKLNELESYARDGYVEKMLTKLFDAPRSLALTTGQWASRWLRIASLAASAAGCAIGVATAVTGIGAVLAGVACGGFLISVASELTGNEDLGAASTGISAVTCVASYGRQVSSCISAGTSLIASAIESAEERIEEEQAGLSFRGEIYSLGRADRYSFYATAGTTVHILLNRRVNQPDGSGTLDPYLYLVHPNGATVQERDDNGSDTPPGPYANAEILHTVSTSGTYLVYASGYQGLGDHHGPYELLIFSEDGLLSNARREATSVSLP